MRRINGLNIKKQKECNQTKKQRRNISTRGESNTPEEQRKKQKRGAEGVSMRRSRLINRAEEVTECKSRGGN